MQAVDYSGLTGGMAEAKDNPAVEEENTSDWPRRHHKIPTFYLQNFAGKSPDGHVWTYDQDTGKSWHTTPSKTATERDYYSLVTADGKRDPITAEFLLSKIESEAKVPLDKLVEGSGLTGEERSDFAVFLALMYLRSPETRQSAADIFAAVVNAVKSTLGTNDAAFEQIIKQFETEHGPQSKEKRKQFREMLTDPSKLKISISQEAVTASTLSLLSDLGKKIFAMEWSVLSTPKDIDLISSDSPVCLNGNISRSKEGQELGFLSPNVIATLPLSPNYLWVGAWNKRIPPRGQMRTQSVKEFNRRCAMNAERFLFAAEFETGIETLAKKYKGRSTKTVFSGAVLRGRELNVRQYKIPTKGLGRVDLDGKPS